MDIHILRTDPDVLLNDLVLLPENIQELLLSYDNSGLLHQNIYPQMSLTCPVRSHILTRPYILKGRARNRIHHITNLCLGIIGKCSSIIPRLLTFSILPRSIEYTANLKRFHNLRKDLDHITLVNMEHRGTCPHRIKFIFAVYILYTHIQSRSSRELICLLTHCFRRIQRYDIISLVQKIFAVATTAAAKIKNPAAWLEMFLKALVNVRHVCISGYLGIPVSMCVVVFYCSVCIFIIH